MIGCEIGKAFTHHTVCVRSLYETVVIYRMCCCSSLAASQNQSSYLSLPFTGIKSPISVPLTYILIYFAWPLFLSVFPFLCLSLISKFESPPWISHPITPLHAHPLPFPSYFSCSFPSINSLLPKLHAYLSVRSLPFSPPPFCIQPLTSFPSNLLSPWDLGPTSWKSHQPCIALNNS